MLGIIKPIEDPKDLRILQELFYVKYSKVNNHENNAPFEKTIGDLLEIATVESVQITEVALSESQDGVVINKKIHIPFNQERVDIRSMNTYFDSNEKASSIANDSNTVSFERATELEKEIKKCKEMLKSALELEIND